MMKKLAPYTLLIGYAAFMVAMLTSPMACAAFGHVVRTVVDVAADTCELWAVKQTPARLNKFSPEDFCKITENVQPYVDQVLAAQRFGAAARVQECKQP